MMQHHRASRPLLEESHTDDELHDLHTKLDRLAHSNRNCEFLFRFLFHCR